MKKLVALLFTVVLTVSVTACSKSTQGNPQNAAVAPENAKKLLYVKRGEGTNDPIVMKHLEKAGYVVIDMADNVFKADKVNGFGVVYISPTVNSARIDPALKHSTVPIVYAKPQSASIGDLTGLLDYGEIEGKTGIQIKDSKLPLAAGLKDQVNVYKNGGKMGYAIPGKEAIVVATAPGDDQKVVEFAYEKGAKNIKGEKVPARQVFFYFTSGEEMNQTDDGLKLLDAAIGWAAQNGGK